MFDIGMPEFFIIGVVALVVLGPERLPEVMGKIGRAYRQLRQMSDQVLGEARAQWEAGMREVEDVTNTVNTTWQEATSETEIKVAPPRVRQLPAPLEAPDTAAAAGPWVLPAWHRPSVADVEPRPAFIPVSPFALERLEAADLGPSITSYSSSSTPPPIALAPTADELAEWDALSAYEASDQERSFRPTGGSAAGSGAEVGVAGGLTARDGTSTYAANGAPGRTTGGVPDAGGPANGSLVDAVREQTIVELYKQGGISLDRAAAFLEMSPAEFLEHLEAPGAVPPSR